ncbi:MAG: hypothetical protein KKF12_21950 [Proteobacteria bacterium]|nr:hypothetical protein [Desulfobacula sp.]MBU4133492.1 hypothetical protein [Pseudomonadota bacterium]
MYEFPQTDLPKFIIDINMVWLRTQLTRGRIPSKAQNPGRGTNRKHPWEEVVFIQTMHHLSFIGRSPKSNALVAEEIQKKISSDRWLIPPKNTYDEICHWIPESDEEERFQEVIFFQFHPDKDATELKRCEFIPRQDVNWDTLRELQLSIEGAYYDYSYMVVRLAETILEHYKYYGGLQTLKE